MYIQLLFFEWVIVSVQHYLVQDTEIVSAITNVIHILISVQVPNIICEAIFSKPGGFAASISFGKC
jgi:hypothetical protein